MNELLKQYPDEIARILAKYPADFKKSAVMPLLYLAQVGFQKLGGRYLALPYHVGHQAKRGAVRHLYLV